MTGKNLDDLQIILIFSDLSIGEPIPGDFNRAIDMHLPLVPLF
jgi:hypothetical protein